MGYALTLGQYFGVSILLFGKGLMNASELYAPGTIPIIIPLGLLTGVGISAVRHFYPDVSRDLLIVAAGFIPSAVLALRHRVL